MDLENSKRAQQASLVSSSCHQQMTKMLTSPPNKKNAGFPATFKIKRIKEFNRSLVLEIFFN